MLCALKECSAPFEPKLGGRPQQYCSTKCQQLVGNRRFRARHAARLRAANKVWRGQNPNRVLAHAIKKFGLTLKQYDVMLAAQDGCCAICKSPPSNDGKRLAVDHDHRTDAVRGLLCTRCNPGVGYFQDSPHLLDRAAAYLRTHDHTAPVAVSEAQ